MTRLRGLGIIGALAAVLFAVPMVASAQDSGPSYCNLITPTVRDVVQDAPAIAAVLNLDPGIPDQTILDQRAALKCGDLPAQTPDQARGELCAVLTEARVEDLVKEINDPNATKGLETVRPALGIILSTSKQQLNCDSAPAPADNATATPAPVGTPAVNNDDPDSDNPNEDIVLDKDGNLVTVTVADPAKDRDCSDYATQKAAQDRLEEKPDDPWNLDVDGDGIACEGLSGQVTVTPQGSANTGDGSTL